MVDATEYAVNFGIIVRMHFLNSYLGKIKEQK